MSIGQAVDATLADRGEQYGAFKDHAEIAQALKKVAFNQDGYERLSADQREALDMIFHKIARILNGNPNLADSWHDIAGYARLSELIINKQGV